jgi:excisionase family DNA binding protein
MAPAPMHYLSPHEVGEIIGISGDTIRRMIKLEKLKAIRMPPGNYYKIPPTEVLRYVEVHNIPLTDVNRRLLETLVSEGNGGGIKS